MYVHLDSDVQRRRVSKGVEVQRSRAARAAVRECSLFT